MAIPDLKWNTFSPWLMALGIYLAATLVYWPSFDFDLIDTDDRQLIVGEREFLKDLSNAPLLLETPFFIHRSTTLAPYHRPMINFSLMLNSQTEEFSASFFHITNFLFHLINITLLAYLLSLYGMNTQAILGTTLLFALHPMTTMAIAWIPGRCDILLTTFVLLATLSLKKWLTELAKPWLFATAFFNLLALWSKEWALILGPFLFIHAWLERRSLRQVKVLGAALGLSIGIFFWFWLKVFPNALSQSSGGLSAFAFKSLTYDLWKLFVPLFPEAFFDIRDVSFAKWGPGLGGMGLLIAFAYRQKDQNLKRLLILLLASLLPNLFASKEQLLENRLYLPSLLTSLIIVFLLQKIPLKKTSPMLLSLPLALFFAILSARHLPAFANQTSFQEKALADAPHHPLLLGNQARIYIDQKEYQKAEEILLKILAQDKNRPVTQNNLGLLYLRTWQLPKAKEAFATTLQIDPYYWQALMNLIIVKAFLLDPSHLTDHLTRLQKLRPQAIPELHATVRKMRLDHRGQSADFLAKYLPKADQ